MLAVGEARGQVARPRRHAVSGRGEYGVDRLRAQTALVRLARRLGLGVGGVERGAVRSSLSHRLVAVGGGEDPRRSAEPRRLRFAVVTGAVEPLMMATGQVADGRQCGRVGERALGEVRVQLHALPVGETEGSRASPRLRSTLRLGRDRARARRGAP